MSIVVALGALAADPEPEGEDFSFNPPASGAFALILVLAGVAAWYRMKDVLERVR
jgi:hypothetical protein